MDRFEAVLQLALDEAERNKQRYRSALKTIEDRMTHLFRYPLLRHNNPAENAIRPFVIGRKNWLFSASVDGAKAIKIKSH
jgi:hypothetical protein